MISASTLAQYIITKCTRDNCLISNPQLQKILFFIQRSFLNRSGQPLFEEEIQAWYFGPVVPEVYRQYCGFGPSPIVWEFPNAVIPENIVSPIDQVIEEERRIDPWSLVKESHKVGNAWSRVFNEGIGVYRVIPVEMIKRYG